MACHVSTSENIERFGKSLYAARIFGVWGIPCIPPFKRIRDCKLIHRKGNKSEYGEKKVLCAVWTSMKKRRCRARIKNLRAMRVARRFLFLSVMLLSKAPRVHGLDTHAL